MPVGLGRHLENHWPRQGKLGKILILPGVERRYQLSQWGRQVSALSGDKGRYCVSQVVRAGVDGPVEVVREDVCQRW